MIDRRGTLHRTPTRRASLRRVALHVETLESRCLLAADEFVAVDVAEPVEGELAYSVLAEECCVCMEMASATIDLEAMEFLIDPIVEVGEIDFSEFMFFSMAFEEGESLPSGEVLVTDEEVVVTEEFVSLASETFIDPMIFASFSVSNDDGSSYESLSLETIPLIAEPLTMESPVEVLPAPHYGGTREQASASTAQPPDTPASRAFAAFGRNPSSFAATVASAFGNFGFDRDSQSDGGFFGGRRRARR